MIIVSLDSSVCIVMGWRSTNNGSVSGRGRDLMFFEVFRMSWGPHRLYLVGTGGDGFYTSSKRPVHDVADSRAEVKHEWSCTSTPHTRYWCQWLQFYL